CCTPIEDYEHSQFDVVTCMEMLEHVQNPELVLHHCKRLLKPNGFLFLSTISRTLKAYASAIIAAEYVLNLIPKQTHDYNKFIKPSELTSLARSLDLSLVDMRGLSYNPISRTASLNNDVSVNYLLVLQDNSL
ncbi:MAG: bifunctional 2-polyprenyl-6-hydroxyphenol methylase/3-demethylubiquinol 3-O-methyltransferase UbiG, partial [bacterium]|nr:bifunctional 2-polyprenyl-6-hydroxyphenol methylase/3-demethylubiquinol 3-O-methyltransferase UbiG [bacterium]